MAREVDGLSVGFIAAGSLLAYAGFKGYSVPTALQAFIQGKVPSGTPQYPITGTPATTGAGSGGGSAPPPAHGSYSNGQLQSLWILAGGNPAKAPAAACIATKESSGNPTVTSANPDGGTNVGLWQLDTPGGKGAGYTIAQLQNPLTNARVAVKGSSNGTDWSAWATAPLCGV